MTAPAPCKTVPLVPTEAQWGGLARDIMMWLDMCEGARKTPRNLFQHLQDLGRDVPQWLREEPEMRNLDHVPSKGTRAAIIYRAMVEDAPAVDHAQVSAALTDRLRAAVQTLRRTPMAIQDVAPLLQEAADEIDALRRFDRENRQLRCGIDWLMLSLSDWLTDDQLAACRKTMAHAGHRLDAGDDDELLVAALTSQAEFAGRIALTTENHDGQTVPTDVARRLAYALQLAHAMSSAP